MKKYKRFIWIGFALMAIFILLLPTFFNLEVETLNSTIRAEDPDKFIELPQGITQYQEADPDTAQTVLLISGFSVPYHILDPIFEALKDPGYHVIIYNLFGRGYSDRPDGKYDQKFFTKQIADLLKALHINNPIDLIGLSMGAPIGAEFTINYPEKVDKLVLIGTVHEAVNIFLLKITYIGEYIMNVFFAPSLVKDATDEYYQQKAHEGWAEKFNVHMKYKGYKKAILATLRNYMSKDKLHVYSELGELQKHVLLIWGKDDTSQPFEGN